jgi:hypothetical protein
MMENASLKATGMAIAAKSPTTIDGTATVTITGTSIAIPTADSPKIQTRLKEIDENPFSWRRNRSQLTTLLFAFSAFARDHSVAAISTLWRAQSPFYGADKTNGHST